MSTETFKNERDPGRKKRCFVVMGYGKKTDYPTGRTLDLDKTYKNVIKPVVIEKGLECVRADEIRHSGVIDVPMYEELLTADLVVADLSTMNPNALYELGVRHALRPWTTILMAEEGFFDSKTQRPPFDLSHNLFLTYKHLGEDIGFDEVMETRTALSEKLDILLAQPATDSPIYTYIKNLEPPIRRSEQEKVMAQVGKALDEASADSEAVPTEDEEALQSPTVAVLVDEGERALSSSDFLTAKTMFRQAMGPRTDGEGYMRPDPYLIQRLALATYKAAQEPDVIPALEEAMKVLSLLDPENSNDPETVGLAGAIEKRMFYVKQQKGGGEEHLNRAIKNYSRGYFLRNDWYNGINLAFLLDVRADTSIDQTNQERIADLVWANRIRREVLEICEKDLETIRARERRIAACAGDEGVEPMREKQTARDNEQEYWCLMTMAEAHFGLGDMANYQKRFDEAKQVWQNCFPGAEMGWMIETAESQIARLRDLLKKHGRLLNPPWSG